MTELLDLEALLQQEEGQYFDRKSLWHGPSGKKHPRNKRAVRDQTATYVAGFANAEGGVLVLGVEDDGDVTGHGYNQDDIENILTVPQKRLKPPQVPGHVEHHKDQELLVFEVDPAPRAVMVTGDGFPYRAHDSVVSMSEEDINAIKQKGLVESAEARALHELAISDLDQQYIEQIKASAGLSALELGEYMVRRQLADRHGTSLTIRYAAALLFARDSLAIGHPNAGVRIFRVHGIERQTGAQHNVQELPRIEGNLIQVITETHKTLTGLIQKSVRLHDLFFKEMPEYPTFAWQEAIVNAVVHRDYGIQVRCIEVWLFDDRMEVKSPGGLLPGISLVDLHKRRHVHASRNPRISRVLTELGVMREQGEGIPRMIEEMEASWLPMPIFITDDQRFEVVLKNTPLFVTSETAWVNAVRDMDLNTRQKRILVARVGEGFTNADYQELNQVNRDVAYREIKELIDSGLITGSEKRGKGATYQVPRLQDSELRSKTGLAGPIERLHGHMAKNGKITNADYREIIGASRGVAKNDLRELVESGVLIPEGKGRGAHYLPGPFWGTWKMRGRGGIA